MVHTNETCVLKNGINLSTYKLKEIIWNTRNRFIMLASFKVKEENLIKYVNKIHK